MIGWNHIFAVLRSFADGCTPPKMRSAGGTTDVSSPSDTLVHSPFLLTFGPTEEVKEIQDSILETSTFRRCGRPTLVLARRFNPLIGVRHLACDRYNEAVMKLPSAGVSFARF